MVGWYDLASHVITFSVHVPQSSCQAVAAWSGHFVEESGEIRTQWLRTSGPDRATTLLGTARLALVAGR